MHDYAFSSLDRHCECRHMCQCADIDSCVASLLHFARNAAWLQLRRCRSHYHLLCFWVAFCSEHLSHSIRSRHPILSIQTAIRTLESPDSQPGASKTLRRGARQLDRFAAYVRCFPPRSQIKWITTHRLSSKQPPTQILFRLHN